MIVFLSDPLPAPGKEATAPGAAFVYFVFD
jgi:hypothetical protein